MLMFKRSFFISLLFVVLFFVAAQSKALSINIRSVDDVIGGCVVGARWDMDVNLDTITENNDSMNHDIMTMVLYDGQGNVISLLTISLPVGYYFIYMQTSFYLRAIPVSSPLTLAIYDTNVFTQDPAIAENSPLRGTINFDPLDWGVCPEIAVSAEPEAETSRRVFIPQFYDGRLNNYDMATPVVAYGHDFEDGRGLVVYSPDGALLLEVHPEAIAAVAECPEENTLIASLGDVALYRLTSCDFQLNAPSLDGTKTYVLIFDSLYNTGYVSYEE